MFQTLVLLFASLSVIYGRSYETMDHEEQYTCSIIVPTEVKQYQNWERAMGGNLDLPSINLPFDVVVS